MVMNLLLEAPDAVPYFTDVGDTLRALGVCASEFDWYVSDIETNAGLVGLPQASGWIGGSELDALLSQSGLQFIWGVFSAFPRGVRVDVAEPPFADGNTRYWQGAAAVRPQLDGASFEVVCWDSSATIVVGVTAEQAQRYRAAYPQAKPL
jgi:hypothetical protein